jgi:DNA-nicking Smr family endonuclease
LHGITQKRRQKAKSAQLKRRGSVQRIAATQGPARFEREGEIGRQDLEFLEAMRELQVKPNRRRPVNPQRLQSVERVQFLADAEGEAEFLSAMERLGVRKLKSGATRRTSEPDSGGNGSRIRGGGAASVADSSWPRMAPPSPGHGGRSQPGTVAASTRNQRMHAPETTVFADEPLDMAAQMDKFGDSTAKYEGAPAQRPAIVNARSGAVAATEPDDELDLHGKTVEEAIRMVQSFLLAAHRRRLRSVVIVTGRGLNSGPGGPVLRGAVLTWLERNGAPYCRDFGPAPGRHGGAGAVLVTMK